MSLKLLYTDLTRFACDAAVIAADESLMSGGSVFGACCSAGGPFLRDALAEASGCETGQAKSLDRAVPVSGMQCRHLIMTAAPVWQGGGQHEAALLADCYHHSLDEAVRLGCKRIGISLIDSGIYGFPKDTAREIAVQAILSHPQIQALDVYLIQFDWQGYGERGSRRKALERYLERMLPECAPAPDMLFAEAEMTFSDEAPAETNAFRKEKKRRNFAGAAAAEVCGSAVPLAERLRQLDEGFTQMLLRKIDESGMTDAECYNKANLSRQLFSKIRSNPYYRPKKETAIALALALQLNLEDTNALLRTAGYSLSHSNKFDVIVEYFISQNHYNVFDINEALRDYDQPLIGSD